MRVDSQWAPQDRLHLHTDRLPRALRVLRERVAPPDVFSVISYACAAALGAGVGWLLVVHERVVASSLRAGGAPDSTLLEVLVEGVETFLALHGFAAIAGVICRSWRRFARIP